MHPQLTLALGIEPTVTFDTYVPGQHNVVACRAAATLARGHSDDNQLFLSGEYGAGKTHLLTAACQLASGLGYRVAYLPGELANQDGALLGLEQSDLLCIDDLQRLDHGAEESLFHCINRCRQSGTRLLLAADRLPGELGIILPDLQTRLTWGAVFHLQALGDDDLASAVRRQAEARGLTMADDVLGYLLRHSTRDMVTLMRILQQLDEASLARQRRITVPLVREVLGLAESSSLA